MPQNVQFQDQYVIYRYALYLVWTALGIPQGQIRLLFDPVQIFMEPVEQEGQQLLRVLLLVA